jgi:hypothetical protein
VSRQESLPFKGSEYVNIGENTHLCFQGLETQDNLDTSVDTTFVNTHVFKSPEQGYAPLR